MKLTRKKPVLLGDSVEIAWSSSSSDGETSESTEPDECWAPDPAWEQDRILARARKERRKARIRRSEEAAGNVGFTYLARKSAAARAATPEPQANVYNTISFKEAPKNKEKIMTILARTQSLSEGRPQLVRNEQALLSLARKVAAPDLDWQSRRNGQITTKLMTRKKSRSDGEKPKLKREDRIRFFVEDSHKFMRRRTASIYYSQVDKEPNKKKRSRTYSFVRTTKSDTFDETGMWDSKLMEKWTAVDVGDWLGSLDYHKYQGVMFQEEITGNELPSLARGDFLKLGFSRAEATHLVKEIQKTIEIEKEFSFLLESKLLLNPVCTH